MIRLRRRVGVVLLLAIGLSAIGLVPGRHNLLQAKTQRATAKSQALIAGAKALAAKPQTSAPPVKSPAPAAKAQATTGKPEAAATPADSPVADKWALIIGISKFKDSSINLKFPAKDARDLYNFLLSEGNFAPDHVKLLLNEEATRGGILSLLGDKWLPRVANPNDLVLIYISTHGSPSSLDVSGVNYLVAYDTDKESLFSTGIPMQDLVRMIKGRVHSDRIVMLLDACHSGAASPDGKAVFHQGNVNVDEIAQGTGQLVISSSAPDQVSWESKDQPNGVFTHFLIEGLRQKGNGTRLGDAYQFMKDKVQEEVLRDRGVLQTPVLRSKWEGSELVLAAPPTKPRAGLKELPVERSEPPAVSSPAAAAPPSGEREIAVATPVTPKKEAAAALTVDLTLWQTYLDTARKHKQDGRYAEAEKILAVAQKEADGFPANDVRRVTTLCELADIYQAEERYSDAEPLLWRVYTDLEKAPGGHGVELASVMANLGGILCQKGKYADADSMCKKALSVREKAGAGEDEGMAKCLVVLAQVNLQAGQHALAADLAQKALSIREKIGSPDERVLGQNVKLLAKIYAGEQKFGDAEPYCKRSMELCERTFGQNSAPVVDSLDLYASVLNQLQRGVEAKRLESRAKTIRAKLGKPTSTRY